MELPCVFFGPHQRASYNLGPAKATRATTKVTLAGEKERTLAGSTWIHFTNLYNML